MPPIFNVDELSLMTPDENEAQKEFVKMLKAYIKGDKYNNKKVDGIHLKNVSVGMGQIGRLVASRAHVLAFKMILMKDSVKNGNQLLDKSKEIKLT